MVRRDVGGGAVVSPGGTAPEPCPDWPPPIPCRDCRQELRLSQPDEGEPDHLLGVCPDCRAWFRIDVAAAASVRVPAPAAGRAIG